MHFTSIFAVTLAALFASLAVANPEANPEPAPQSPAQASAAVLALSSYYRSLIDSPAITSFATRVTASSQLAAITAWEASITSELLASRTPASNFLDTLPTDADIRSFYSSVYAAQTSILGANGVTISLQPTSTSTGGAMGAKETGAMKVGALLAGAVGVVMAL